MKQILFFLLLATLARCKDQSKNRGLAIADTANATGAMPNVIIILVGDPGFSPAKFNVNVHCRRAELYENLRILQNIRKNRKSPKTTKPLV